MQRVKSTYIQPEAHAEAIDGSRPALGIVGMYNDHSLTSISKRIWQIITGIEVYAQLR